jgi:hypothetical protein
VSPSLLRASAFGVCAACSAPGSVVSAPSVAPTVAAPSTEAPRGKATGSRLDLTACSQKWTLEDVEGGAGRVVVVCGNDVRRQDVEPGAMTRAIDPALEPARERVCACAARMTVPAFVDLVVTSSPDEGRARVEPGELDDELDAELAAPFLACVGTVKTTFPRSHADACGADKATFVYPLRVDLLR